MFMKRKQTAEIPWVNRQENELEKDKELYIPPLEYIEKCILQALDEMLKRSIVVINEDLYRNGFTNRKINDHAALSLLMEALKENYEQEGYMVVTTLNKIIVYHPKYPYTPNENYDGGAL
jgi:hypothetical protein